jgi:D-alanine transaminase
MPELACVNGRIMPIEAAMVPIEDRGYQFSDSVYEVIATYHGRLFLLERHLDRLQKSMRDLAFPPLSIDRLRDTILELQRQAGFDRAAVYVQISRGVAPRNHPFPHQATPQVVMTVRQPPEIPAECIREGIRAITVDDIRWKRCDIKTVGLLPNVLAKQQALDAGARDAIFISAEGVVREATSSNLFIRKGDRLRTHPLTPAILPGITRAVLIEICREREIAVDEDFFNEQEMMTADEVMLTGTLTEVLPVTRINDRTIGKGLPGTMSRELRSLLEQRATTSAV